MGCGCTDGARLGGCCGDPVAGPGTGRCDVTSASAPMGDEIEATVAWLPMSARGMDPAVLAEVQPVAQGALRAAAPRDRIEARRLMRAMYPYLGWALAERGTLDAGTVWHPHTVDDYLDDVKDEESIHWRHNTRVFLARAGRAANPTGWPRRQTPLGKSILAEPYSAAMESSLGLAAELRCLQHGGAAEAFTFVGSIAAGMPGTEIENAKPSDIINLTADRLAICVHGRHERVVPIRAPYTRLAQLAVEAANGQPFIDQTSRHAVYRAAERVAVTNGGHLSFPRARNTWLSAHLRAGTEWRHLARISRPVHADTLTALIQIAADDIDPMEAALRGLTA